MKKLIIIMGVSGSGKTTVARHIAKHIAFEYMESDNFHSSENQAHVKSGRPLTDDMRGPWIENICEAIKRSPEDIVLANCGLKSVHRSCFRKLDRFCHFFTCKCQRKLSVRA